MNYPKNNAIINSGSTIGKSNSRKRKRKKKQEPILRNLELDKLLKPIRFLPTSHFVEMMKGRKIPVSVVILCLTKGRKCKPEKGETHYCMDVTQLNALRPWFADDQEEMQCVTCVCVVAIKNKLITCYKKNGDTGFSSFELYD